MTPAPPDAPLDPSRLRAALAGTAFGSSLEIHEETASTNDLARTRGLAGAAHGLVILAESQTAGRGRREHRWHAEPRQDLLFSALLRPAVKPAEFARLSTLAALGLCRGIEEGCRLSPLIKWPNDLLLGTRKFCGILAEMFPTPTGPFLVLGIGINVNRTEFPPEIRESATSLRIESGDQCHDRTRLAIALLRSLEATLASWTDGFDAVLDEVTRRSFLTGRRIRARQGTEWIEGIARGLGSEGELVVERDDGSRIELASAEHVRTVPA